MNNRKFILVLVFQLLFFAKMFPQNNKFIIAWYDYSNTGTSVGTMAQQYKDMKTHNINCVITEKREKKIICKRNILYLCKPKFLNYKLKFNIKVK